MRKILLTLTMLTVALITRAVTATVYVQSEEKPYLYCWYMVGNNPQQPLGVWPGTELTETEVVMNVTFWKMTISTPEEITSFNIIFNNGRGGQTEDILGLSSDRYYSYDGYTGYTDISEQFGKVPNAEISQVELRGDFNGWEEGGNSIMTKGEGHVYTMQVDLGDNVNDQQFKLVVNGSIYGGLESMLKIDAPEGWVGVYGAGTINESGYIILRHSITDYKSYILTATWEENPNAIDGWTLKVEGKDYKYELIDVQEWQVLAAWYASVGQGTGWSKPWDFSTETLSTRALPGVTATDGHVVGINLSNRNISSGFPYPLLKLPYLKTLNLSNNNLTGAIESGLATELILSSVEDLNIANNKLSGNIGVFALFQTKLKSIDASYNCLEYVSPTLSSKITSLNLSHQTIDVTADLHTAHFTAEEVIEKVPRILLYDHQNRTFTSDIVLPCTSQDKSWVMTIACQNGKVTVYHAYAEGQNAYHGASGDILNVNMPDGSSFRATLSFDEGDGNFDGQINVLDLQTTINYMFEEYTTKPFNFTAANLWEDNVINVQDAVSLVNLLLEPESASARMQNRARRISGVSSEATASVFIENGKLIVSSAVPVASFDIVISSGQEWTMAEELSQIGFACMTRRDGNQIHLIGYSLNGTTLPVGQTTIGETGNGIVSYVMLADEDAQEIPSTTNTSTTGIQSTIHDSDSKSYRLSIGANRAIMIDANGKKTMIKNEK